MNNFKIKITFYLSVHHFIKPKEPYYDEIYF